jgi:nucleoside-diphosphate-sugar epimerase
MPEKFFLNQLIETLNRNEVFEMTGGEQIRDFIHIDDLIASMIALTKSEKGNGEIINISSGKGVMLKKLAIKIAGKYKKESLLKIGALPYRDNEVWEMIGNNQKLMSMNVNNQFPVFEEKLETIIQI